MSSIGSFERLSTDEVDPVADFVAREQNLLAELDDPQIVANPFEASTNRSVSKSPLEQLKPVMESNDSFDPFGVQQANSIKLESSDDLFAIDSNASATDLPKTEPIVSVVETDDEPAFLVEAEIVQPSVPNESIDITEPSTINVTTIENVKDNDTQIDNQLDNQLDHQLDHQLDNDAHSSANSTSIESNGFVKVSSMPSEPETMTRWREVQRERLEQKDAKEKAANDQLREQAKAELDDWYGTYQRSLEKRKQDNREAQETFEQDRDVTKPGQDWVKVASYCDFANKSAQGRDLSRMRAILLKQKQMSNSNSTQELTVEQ